MKKLFYLFVFMLFSITNISYANHCSGGHKDVSETSSDTEDSSSKEASN